MSELKNIVPSLELCKMIPKGEFAESALIWSDWRNGDGGKRGFAVYFRENLLWPNSLPAPTLAEILEELEQHDHDLYDYISLRADRGGKWKIHNGIDGTIGKTLTDTALRLWLKLKEI